MTLPFTTEQFLEVFKTYNQNVSPIQFLFYLPAVAAIWLSWRKIRYSGIVIVCILSFLFAWTGIVYHIMHFTAINPAAYVFGAAFILQSLLVLYYGLLKRRLTFKIRFDAYGITGMIFVLYALILYPLIGYSNGHVYPYAPTFGVPCPTMIFTFGLMLWSEEKFPKLLLLIPLLWAIIGLSAATLLGMTEDFGLLVSALLTITLTFVKDKRRMAAQELNAIK